MKKFHPLKRILNPFSKEMIDTKIKYWQSIGIEVNDGAEDKDILILEKHLSFSFPEDFKTFYLSLNGFKEREWT